MENKLKSNGQAAKTAGRQMSGLQGDIDKLASAYQVFIDDIGGKTEGLWRTLVQIPTQILRGGHNAMTDWHKFMETFTGQNSGPKVVIDLAAPVKINKPAGSDNAGGGGYSAAIKGRLSLMALEEGQLKRLIDARQSGINQYRAVANIIKVENELRKAGISTTDAGYDAAMKQADGLITYRRQLELLDKAERTHTRTISYIKGAYASLPKTYAQATSAAAKWREEALAGLDDTKAGYLDFTAMVDDVYRNKLSQAYASSLVSSREWQDGLIRGFNNINDSAYDMASQFEGAVGRMSKRGEDAFVGLAKGTMTLTEAWRSMADSIIEDMLRMQYQSMIAGPVSGFLSGALSDIFSFSGGGTIKSAGGGPVQVAHTGGVLGFDGLASRAVNPAIFASAPRFHSGGLVGGEIPAILKRGEGVFTPGQMRAMGPPRSASKITIIDQRGASAPDVQVNQSFSPDNEALIEIIIPAVETAADRGMLDEAFARNFANHRNPAVGS